MRHIHYPEDYRPKAISKALASLLERVSETKQIVGWPAQTYFHRHINPDKTLGGWVENDARIDAGVHIDAEAVVFKKGVHLRKGARITGASVFGPYAETEGNVRIHNAHCFGDEVPVTLWPHGDRGTSYPLPERGEYLVQGLRALAARPGVTKLVNSEVDNAVVYASKVSEARVAGEARLEDVKVTAGAVIDRPVNLSYKTVSDFRYATPEAVLAASTKGGRVSSLAASGFSRAGQAPVAEELVAEKAR